MKVKLIRPQGRRKPNAVMNTLSTTVAESLVLGYLHLSNLGELQYGQAYSRPRTSGCKSPQTPTFCSSHLLKVPLHSVPDLIRQLQTRVHASLPRLRGAVRRLKSCFQDLVRTPGPLRVLQLKHIPVPNHSFSSIKEHTKLFVQSWGHREEKALASLQEPYWVPISPLSLKHTTAARLP